MKLVNSSNQKVQIPRKIDENMYKARYVPVSLRTIKRKNVIFKTREEKHFSI